MENPYGKRGVMDKDSISVISNFKRWLTCGASSNYGGSGEVVDKFVWLPDPMEGYSVKSGYEVILAKTFPISITEDKSRELLILWTLPASFRIKAFGWRNFFNRLLSKDKL
ncbi:hypothetical protein KIW84_010251 [Lathyrus oleraceus]|uniref:Uncharacterized protein n=1 Tax=Pisum sativum TaxID=3888 RepID=A0A9D5BDJ0_PEA|nr:hypothetical protein KIW84_010251 [Pisum sativum]